MSETTETNVVPRAEEFKFKKDQIVAFVDAVGHVSLATFVEDLADGLRRIKNPLWVSLVQRPDPNNPGKPVTVLETPAWFFRDFLSDHNDDQIWDLPIKNYAWLSADAFSGMLKVHYYNSFSHIDNGVKQRLDENGKPVQIPPKQETPELK